MWCFSNILKFLWGCRLLESNLKTRIHLAYNISDFSRGTNTAERTRRRNHFLECRLQCQFSDVVVFELTLHILLKTFWASDQYFAPLFSFCTCILINFHTHTNTCSVGSVIPSCIYIYIYTDLQSSPSTELMDLVGKSVLRSPTWFNLIKAITAGEIGTLLACK